MINETHFKSFPKLETERLMLRAATLDDAASLQRIRTNPAVMEHMDTFYHHDLQVSKDFITHNLDGYTNKKVIYWMLQEKASGTVIGDFSFWNMDHKHHRTEIGYTLHPDFWGKGYMKEAMLTLFSFGFKDLNIHSFEANTNPKNKNSQNILLKLGFKKEAYFRESFFYNGEYLDSEIFCLLETDYESSNFT